MRVREPIGGKGADVAFACANAVHSRRDTDSSLAHHLQLVRNAGTTRRGYFLFVTVWRSFEAFLDVARVLGLGDQHNVAFDPHETDFGRARAGQELAQRVRR
ncbi:MULTISPECIES: hypothetical protein [unclassified Arthrobacter]|uniref:hypothetical protein n=1 Tax=unclassified Arthrobacter TaxID=235627 RepID=UPI0033978C0F